MKKKLLLQAAIGAPIGVTISTLLSIIFSYCTGTGTYYPVVSAFAAACPNEISAVLIQFLVSMLYGAMFGAASLIWDTDWSLLKMTVSHFLICALGTFPVAYFMRWMPHKLSGILIYFGIFIAIYILIWFSQHMIVKKKITALNRKMAEEHRPDIRS